MSKKKTTIGSFIHSRWTYINQRACNGLYYKNNNKNKCYLNIKILFTRLEFKKWCYDNEEKIISLKKPSIDRINSNDHYSLKNIQVIELSDNIKKKRFGCRYVNGPNENTIRGIRQKGKSWSARITSNKKELYLGSFSTKEEAMSKFYNKYIELHNKAPW